MIKATSRLLADYGRRLLKDRLTTGTGGNLSLALRTKNLIAISPSDVDYEQISPKDISLMNFNGVHLEGLPPSSEWYLHLEIYKTRPEINAVVHTHSRFATTFAVLRQPIPACHYLIGIAEAREIRLAPYATFGTPELARQTAAALGRENCILMANHGLLAVGENLKRAYETALYIEEVAEIYYRACSLGSPFLLNKEEMDEALLRFQSYKKPDAASPGSKINP
ncbi:MAG TPA: hypothetical protein ENN66_08590 [Proteobacteria bacterium]|nr:hypothetical protein [Pseudomonadota bacterium]